jgi:transcriptional regulator with XRE-family HTH domain
MYGEILKNLRIEKGLTQQQLSEILGFKSASAAGMVEREERELSVDKLISIADYFNVSTDYLMGIVPFKNETEAYHSISVATIKNLREDSQISLKELKDYVQYIPEYADISNYEVKTYCEDLISKYVAKSPLTNLEFFEISNIIFSSIRWAPDYSGTVYYEYFYDTFIFPSTMVFDFNKMEKITLDLIKSILLNYKDRKNNFVKYSSILDSKSKDINNSDRVYEQNDISSYLGTTDKKIRDMDTLEDFEDAEQALKFIISQPILAAYGGYDLNNMSDEEIIEIANDMLFAMRLSLEKLRKKTK